MSTVLIVDDHPPSRQFLATLMGYAGHDVLEACDGLNAIACARTNHPDLVISDIQMPHMDGRELVRALKSEQSLANIPVIFYTATFRESQARQIAESCGVKLVITKPTEPEVILSTVQNVLGEQKLFEEAAADNDVVMTVHAASLQLSAVIELGLHMAREREPGRLLALFCRGIRSIIGLEAITLGTLNPEGNIEQFITEGSSESPEDMRLAFHGFLGALVQLKHRGVITQTELLKRAADVPFRMSKTNSFLSLPIETENRIYGWLYVGDKTKSAQFSADDERLITTLAAQLAVAYENLSFCDEIRGAAERLRKSEEKYRTCIQNASCGICHTDNDGKILLANPALLEMFGYETEEELSAADLPFSKVVRGHGADGSIPGVEVSWPKTSVDSVLLRISGRAARTEEGSDGFDLIVEDITRSRELERQLQQSQKMEAVGRLAGGIAHDFNNLLTIILGYANMTLEEHPTDSAISRTLKEIKQAGDRAASLTRQLLSFSRKAIIQPEVLDLNQVISHTEKMLQRLIGEDIQLEVVAAPDLHRVKVDRGQIEQVLMNLLVNARDAMPQGGRLLLETSNQGNHVLLSVRDSGCGMSDEVMARVFEPFFTTKESGTGLGLSIVYGIVHQNGGQIEVNSETGLGTTVRIFLPRAASACAVSGQPQEADALHGTETVLLVEDEEMVRTLTTMVLRKHGYTVIAAASGEEALAAAAQTSRIDILLSDVVMPQMSGRELRDRLMQQLPNVKVLFMSGYLDDAIVRHGICESDVAFIQKPFVPEMLARKVRETLGAAEAL